MRLTEKDRLFVLTGAGVSAESGLATFRGAGGLWNGYKVTQVATPEAWTADPRLVWDFYSMRRRDAAAAEPNAGHLALAELERKMGNRFYLRTQNVDDLHERAGSQRIHHMHGQLFQSRCVRCEEPFEDRETYDGGLPKCKRCGAAVRPHIVWFGEVPLEMESIYAELERATVMMVVGTSGTVYPAAGFVEVARRLGVRTVYVGPEDPLNVGAFEEVLVGTAAGVLPGLVEGVAG